MVSVSDALEADPDQSWDNAVLGIIETGGELNQPSPRDFPTPRIEAALFILT